MNSLVERLRATEKRTSYLSTARTAPVLKSEYDAPINPDGPEAANEIERLREALRRIGLPEDTERTLMPLEMRMIAREALSLHKADRHGD